MGQSKVFNLLFVISIFTLTACASESTNVGAIETSSKQESTWNCNSISNGLGEDFSCSTQTWDESKSIWTLNIMCSSDLVARHSITGVDSNVEKIILDKNLPLKVRIDSLPIEEWQYSTKAEGQGLVFGDYTLAKSFFDADKIENSATWNFLSEISSAKSIGLKIYDVNGNPHQPKFDIRNSIPIAAKFNTLGCKS